MGVAAAPVLSMGVLAMLSGFCLFSNGATALWTEVNGGSFRGHIDGISAAGACCLNVTGDKVENEDDFEGL